jgi:hypothetical protein
MAEEDKDAKRWRFVLTGEVLIAPVYDNEGDTMYIMVESDSFVAKCRNSHEVNNAVDIAAWRAEHIDEETVMVH